MLAWNHYHTCCHMFPHHCHISSHHLNTTVIYSFTTATPLSDVRSFTTGTPLSYVHSPLLYVHSPLQHHCHGSYVHSPLQHRCHMFIHHCNTTTIYSLTTATPLLYVFTPVPPTAPHALLTEWPQWPTHEWVFSHATLISKAMYVLRRTCDSMSCASRRL